MKILSVLISLFFLTASNIIGEDGFLVDYNVSGTSIGGTKIKGNLKVLMIKNLKKITGNLFFQEPGQPFPDLVEKSLKVDFNNAKKYIDTGDGKAGVTMNLDDDYKLINSNGVKINAEKTGSDADIVILITSPPELGGNQKYSIKMSFNKSTSQQESAEMAKYKKPTATGLISFFTDNEKLIDFINLKLGAFKNMFPSKFSIRWEQNNILQLDVKGTMKSKVMMDLSVDDFED